MPLGALGFLCQTEDLWGTFLGSPEGLWGASGGLWDASGSCWQNLWGASATLHIVRWLDGWWLVGWERNLQAYGLPTDPFAMQLWSSRCYASLESVSAS